MCRFPGHELTLLVSHSQQLSSLLSGQPYLLLYCKQLLSLGGKEELQESRTSCMGINLQLCLFSKAVQLFSLNLIEEKEGKSLEHRGNFFSEQNTSGSGSKIDN